LGGKFISRSNLHESKGANVRRFSRQSRLPLKTRLDRPLRNPLILEGADSFLKGKTS
jgi:hypothetical protein